MSNKANNEKQLTNQIVKAIQERFPEAWILKVHGGGYQRAGVPDLLVSIGDGILRGIEVKHQKPGETPEHARGRATVHQLKEIESIRKAGGVADVVLSVEEALELLTYR